MWNRGDSEESQKATLEDVTWDGRELAEEPQEEPRSLGPQAWKGSPSGKHSFPQCPSEQWGRESLGTGSRRDGHSLCLWNGLVRRTVISLRNVVDCLSSDIARISPLLKPWYEVTHKTTLRVLLCSIANGSPCLL